MLGACLCSAHLSGHLYWSKLSFPYPLLTSLPVVVSPERVFVILYSSLRSPLLVAFSASVASCSLKFFLSDLMLRFTGSLCASVHRNWAFDLAARVLFCLRLGLVTLLFFLGSSS